MNELLCPVACMDSCCCFSAFSFNTVWNVAKWTCFSLKRAFLGLKYFSSFCSSHSTPFPKFSISQCTPQPLLCYFWFWVTVVPFCSFLPFSWAAEVGVLPAQDSPCLPAFRQAYETRSCLELYRVFAAFAVLSLLSLVMFCAGFARIKTCNPSLFPL